MTTSCHLIELLRRPNNDKICFDAADMLEERDMALNAETQSSKDCRAILRWFRDNPIICKEE